MAWMRRTTLIAGVLLFLVLVACSPGATPEPELVPPDTSDLALQRDPDVPALPFPDNPDPTQCGIPVQWGQDEPAWLTGYYEGELVQPIVYFYDSHLRYSIAGSAPSGTEVRVMLYQSNPALDYYMVETIDLDPQQNGWVPAPFLQFESPQQRAPDESMRAFLGAASPWQAAARRRNMRIAARNEP